MNAERPATESVSTFDDLFALIPPEQTNRTLKIMGNKLLLTSSPNALDIRLAETAMRLAAWAFDTCVEGEVEERVMKGDLASFSPPKVRASVYPQLLHPVWYELVQFVFYFFLLNIATILNAPMYSLDEAVF
jgi:hypothetical protein